MRDKIWLERNMHALQHSGEKLYFRMRTSLLWMVPPDMATTGMILEKKRENLPKAGGGPAIWGTFGARGALIGYTWR